MKRTLLLYLLIVVMLAALQRFLIFHPTKEAVSVSNANFPTGQVHDISTQTADGIQLHGWHVLPDGTTAADQAECDRYLNTAKLVVLFFSGNAGHRGYRSEEFRVFSSMGAHVMVFDYRGYGENAGSPSEKGLTTDAQAVWQYVTEERGVGQARLVLFGESLGGGVAIRLAAEKCREGTPPAGLVLRSTFSSIVDTASHHYPWIPVSLLLIDRFESTKRIPDVTCPIVHVHGTQDTIVPIGLGRKLFSQAPQTSQAGFANTFVEIPLADHNDVLLVAEKDFQAAVRKLFEQIQ